MELDGGGTAGQTAAVTSLALRSLLRSRALRLVAPAPGRAELLPLHTQEKPLAFSLGFGGGGGGEAGSPSFSGLSLSSDGTSLLCRRLPQRPPAPRRPPPPPASPLDMGVP